MVAILYPRRLRNLLDVTQPLGTGLPDQGVPLLFSSNSSFVIDTIAAGGNSFSLGASNLGNTLGDTGVTGTRLVLAGIGRVTLSQSTDAAGGTISISGGTAGAGAFSGGVSNIGNSLGTTGITGTQMVFAGGNNITLSQSVDGDGGTITISGPTTVAQSVQTQNRFNLTLDGNTAGALAQISSGTMTLAGGNGITLSQAGNAVTISGNTFTQSVQPETQTFIGGISASNTLYTSGTVNITGSGIVTVQSGTGQRVIVNASQSVQSQSRFNLTIGGNTSGAGALISSGVMTLAGGNNITVSQAGNALTISGPNVGGAQTGISGIANSQTTFTSGTVSFSELGAITIRSTTGNQFQLSVNSQSVQPETQTFVGGIAASDTTYTSGTVRITGVGGGVTVSSNTGQRVDISVAAQSVQPETQTFVGGIIASNTTYTSGSIRFTGVGGGITVSSNTGQRVDLSVAAQTVQTQNLIAMTLSGNTSGAQALISSGTMTLAGGNNITVSQNGNAVTISGPNVGGAQTGISGIIGSDATYTSGTVQFTGSNMITVKSSAGQRIVIDATQSVQTQSLFSAGVSTGGNTAGDTGVTGTRMVFVGSQNITLLQATAAAGGTITIQGPTTAAQTNQSGGAYAVGNTYSSSSGTFDARTLSIRGDGIISVAATNSGWRISASQSVQAETQTFVGGLAASNTTYTSGTITITGVGGGVTVSSNTGQRIDISVAAQSVQPVMNLVASNTTFSSGTVSISGFGAVTVNTAANIIRISAPVQTAQTGISGLANSQTTYTSGTVSLSELGAITIRSTTGNQFQLSVNAQTEQTQSRFNLTMSGNTSGAGALVSSGVMTLAGGNNITLSQAGNAITISAPNLGAGAMSAGVSNLGNSAGATGITGTQLVFVGSDNITLSQTTGANGGTVSIIGGAGGGFSAGVSTGGNTAGATGVSGTRMVLVGTGPISLSQTTGAAGNTVSIDAPATSSLVGVSGISISTNGSTISIMQTTGASFLTSLAPYDESPMVTGLQGQGTLCFAPVRFPTEVQFDRVGLGIQISNATNSSGSFTLSQWFALYTKNVSTLSLLASTSISTNFTGSGTQGSYSLYAGPQWQTIPWTTTISGGDYYAGVILRSTSGGANHSISQLLMSKFTNSAWSGIMGVASATSVQRLLGQGHYSATTSQFPATVHFNQIIGSGSIALRSPLFMVRSGTV